MRKAFTMVELIIVMVIMGIMAGFSIPNFTKTINRARSRDAVLNMNIIHASNVLYRVRNGVDLAAANLVAINTALNLNIIANGATYVCNAGSCTATGTGFTVTATLGNPLSPGVNPTCVGTSCP